MTKLKPYGIVAALFVLFAFASAAARAQDEADGDSAAPTTGPKFEAWEAKLTEWKALLSDLRDLRERYGVAQNEELDAIRQQYNTKVAQGKELLAELKEFAHEAFEESPNADEQLTRFMLKLVTDELRAERYQRAYEKAKYLIENGMEDDRVYNMAGSAAFAANHIAEAKEYLEKAQAAGVLTKDGREALSMIAQYDA